MNAGRALTPDEAKALIRAAEPLRLGAAVTLLFSQGWRASEVLGLAWEDLDLDAGEPVGETPTDGDCQAGLPGATLPASVTSRGRPSSHRPAGTLCNADGTARVDPSTGCWSRTFTGATNR